MQGVSSGSILHVLLAIHDSHSLKAFVTNANPNGLHR